MSEIIPHLPYSEYAKRAGVNATLLKLVHKKSLLHARAYLDGTYSEESDDLDFGHCFHSLALEGREDFVVKPETYTNDKGEVKKWIGSANVCKAWEAAQGDKIPLSVWDTGRVRTMAKVVRQELGDFLKGRIELSLFAKRGEIPVKNRVDFLPEDDSAPVIDLKSAASAEPAKFLRAAVDKGYHLQAAFTLDTLRLCGIDRKAFWLVAVEKEAPHAHTILKFNDVPLSLLRVGRAAYRAALAKLIHAEDTGRWDGYGNHTAEDFAPVWMKEELELTA